MDSFAEALASLHREISSELGGASRARDVQVVAVSKRQPAERLRAAHATGQVDFGENYAQELRDKRRAMEGLDPPIRWHYIGQLQRNKIKYVLGCHLLHTVDSWGLAQALAEACEKKQCVQDLLVQVRVPGDCDAHRGGCALADAPALIKAMNQFPALRCHGLMAMSTAEASSNMARQQFLEVAAAGRDCFESPILSMGMSHDWREALAAGATHLRIGTALFGHRSGSEADGLPNPGSDPSWSGHGVP